MSHESHEYQQHLEGLGDYRTAGHLLARYRRQSAELEEVKRRLERCEAQLAALKADPLFGPLLVAKSEAA